MIGSIRNQFEKICPKCGKTIIIKELNDGSPKRDYDCAICPICGEILHEDYIVGAFKTEVKQPQPETTSRLYDSFQESKSGCGSLP